MINRKHRLGQRGGKDGVDVLWTRNLNQPGPSAQSCLCRHYTGACHTVTAANQQKPALIPFIGLWVQGGKGLGRPGKLGNKGGSLPSVRQGTRDAHLPDHCFPTVPFGRKTAMGRLFPGKGYGHMGLEGIRVCLAGVAHSAAGQIGGNAAAGQAVCPAEQSRHILRQPAPKPKTIYAVYQNLGMSQNILTPRLPGDNRELGQPEKGLLGQSRGWRALNQQYSTVCPPAGQYPGANKAIAAIVALAA